MAPLDVSTSASTKWSIDRADVCIRNVARSASKIERLSGSVTTVGVMAFGGEMRDAFRIMALRQRVSVSAEPTVLKTNAVNTIRNRDGKFKLLLIKAVAVAVSPETWRTNPMLPFATASLARIASATASSILCPGVRSFYSTWTAGAPREEWDCAALGATRFPPPV